MVVNKKTSQWLEIGYKHFALYGPENLSIDKMAQDVGISRTSFYYHFSDMDSFIDDLLILHVENARQIKEECICNCKNYIPDFIKIIADHKVSVIFNKQLAANRTIPRYALAYNHANNIVDNASLDLWSEEFAVTGDRNFRMAVFHIIRDSFYNRITFDTMNFESILEMVAELRAITLMLVKNNMTDTGT